MSETFWAHKKWNKTASDIKFVFLFSNNVAVCLSVLFTVNSSVVSRPIMNGDATAEEILHHSGWPNKKMWQYNVKCWISHD